MRLFIAVNFNEEIKRRILEVQARLRAQSLKGNFTRPENLHLTLAFLGEIDENKLSPLSGIIEGIRSSPFEISFNRSGCFTHSHKELWWIGTDKNRSGFSLLENIHRQLVDQLSKAAIPVDTRPFNVHITVGREIKHSSPIMLVCPEITVKVDRISLMKSENVRGLLTYTEIMWKDLSIEN